MKEIEMKHFPEQNTPYKHPLSGECAWVGIHLNETALHRHSNNVKTSQRYKAYSSHSPKLLVAGLPPPLYTHAQSPLRNACTGVPSQKMLHPISFMSLICVQQQKKKETHTQRGYLAKFRSQ
ncbi:hypothetical protein CEXT_267641 [Caerostris extrusa]|uniref:Uncharacterized protein n=1 Tax=Caerostris extrusa TaxID=172846 RepID=A0AAV4ULB3_CAEEX|nr:hypothetical protein CEXT_267641 [Caerostris extrusa]